MSGDDKIVAGYLVFLVILTSVVLLVCGCSTPAKTSMKSPARMTFTPPMPPSPTTNFSAVISSAVTRSIVPTPKPNVLTLTWNIQLTDRPQFNVLQSSPDLINWTDVVTLPNDPEFSGITLTNLANFGFYRFKCYFP